MPAFTDRGCMLRNLVTFRKIRIKIIFTRKIIETLYCAMAGQTRFNGILDRFPVRFRQSTWMAQRNGTDMGIWSCAKSGTVARKQFAKSFQLCMNFQTNYSFVLFARIHYIKIKKPLKEGTVKVLLIKQRVV